MPQSTRREFLHTSSCMLAGGALLLQAGAGFASPFGLPIGLQLYSVREELAKDYAGTLQRVAAAGYKEVEAAGFFDKTPGQVREAMRAAGLDCVSAHYSYTNLTRDLDQTIGFNKEIGLRYIICAVPGIKNPDSAKGTSLTLDDYRWNADEFNRIGAKIKAAGMKFGYHNHTVEFHPVDGAVPMDELIRLTDASLVTFEMDCGWVVVGGGDPVEYLRHYPTRFSMLHIKDFKMNEKPAAPGEPPPAAELGQGTIDLRSIFVAAKKLHIKHYFVEQEGYDMPVFEALKLDAQYMRKHRT